MVFALAPGEVPKDVILDATDLVSRCLHPDPGELVWWMCNLAMELSYVVVLAFLSISSEKNILIVMTISLMIVHIHRLS